VHSVSTSILNFIYRHLSLNKGCSRFYPSVVEADQEQRQFMVSLLESQ
jgi:hypothetical protein